MKAMLLAALLSGCTVLVPRGVNVSTARDQAEFCRLVYPAEGNSGVLDVLGSIRSIYDQAAFSDCLNQFGIHQ